MGAASEPAATSSGNLLNPDMGTCYRVVPENAPELIASGGQVRLHRSSHTLIIDAAGAIEAIAHDSEHRIDRALEYWFQRM